MRDGNSRPKPSDPPLSSFTHTRPGQFNQTSFGFKPGFFASGQSEHHVPSADSLLAAPNLYLSQQLRSGTISVRNRIPLHRPTNGQGENAMKIRTILLTASLAIASLGISASASAQNYNGGDRHDSSQDTGHRNDHRNDQRDHRYDSRDHRDDRGWRGDRGRHNGWNRHQHCWTEWHHHHHVRVCR
jgi:hypothetical protein